MSLFYFAKDIIPYRFLIMSVQIQLAIYRNYFLTFFG